MLLLKLIENSQTIWWAYRYGRDAARELFIVIEKWKRTGIRPAKFADILKRNKPLWSPEAWTFTKFFMTFNSRASTFFIDYTFRYPTLMIIQTLTTIGVTKTLTGSSFLAIGIFFLWIGSWIGIVHVMAHRFTLGYLANQFPRNSVRVEHYLEQHIEELMPPRSYLVSRFAIHFVIILVVIILAYTGIYTGLNDLLDPASNSPVFYGLGKGWEVPFELLYFSIVTTATVGYGDIYPMQNHLIARLAVASQILSGLSLFVFLLTAFTLTVEPEIFETKGTSRNRPTNDH